MDGYERPRDEYRVSTDRDLLDIEVIHGFLERSYWSPGVTKDVVAKAVENSLCFGLYLEDAQIGFARFVTDYARHAYLCDVFVLPEFRGRKLGQWLVQCAVECPLINGVRTISLDTSDAHGLYEKLGFVAQANSTDHMALKFDMPWFRPELIDE